MLAADAGHLDLQQKHTMDLTNSQRVLKLAGALVRQPQYTPSYLLSNLFPSRHSPLAQNLPWWSFAAIREADRLFPGKQIFEWGSGGSTLRYAQKGAQITAIEDDSDWMGAVQKGSSTRWCCRSGHDQVHAS